MPRNSAECTINVHKSNDLTEDEIFELEHNLGCFGSMLGIDTTFGPQTTSQNDVKISFITDYRAIKAIQNYLFLSLKLDCDYNVQVKFNRIT